ncbi:8626_t:CDS:1, partial [Rhizophagus irregularis]
EVWRSVGLARQATQLAVEHDSHGEIIGWLKKFIDKHKEIEIAQNQDLMEVQVNNNKENEPLQVENPLVSQRKGRPETK